MRLYARVSVFSLVDAVSNFVRYETKPHQRVRLCSIEERSEQNNTRKRKAPVHKHPLCGIPLGCTAVWRVTSLTNYVSRNREKGRGCRMTSENVALLMTQLREIGNQSVFVPIRACVRSSRRSAWVLWDGIEGRCALRQE